MDDFGMLAKDLGFRPQGKSAPMKSGGGDRRGRPTSSSSSFGAEENDMFNGVFGSPTKYTNNNSKSTPSMSDFDYDSIFKEPGSAKNNEAQLKSTSFNSNLNSPVYDKPLYDDDIFDGLPGVKSKPVSSPASSRIDHNIFASMATSPAKKSDQFDDLFGNLGRTEKAESIRHHNDSPRGLDDLIPGFASSPASHSRWSSQPSPKSASKKSNAIDDPFAGLESMSSPVTSSPTHFTNPLEDTKFSKSRSTKSADVFGDMDPLNGFNKSTSTYAKETNNRAKGQIPSDEGSNMSSKEPIEESSFAYSENQPPKMHFDDFQESQQNSQRSFERATSPGSYSESSSQVGTSPNSDDHMQHTDDIWLTVSEIPLFTPITRAPPPSRPPPPIPRHTSKTQKASFSSSNSAKERDEHTMDEEIRKDREEEERLERERIQEMEREKVRKAVERATREARERAATEARLKVERAAVQRAQAEARERAAVEARERAERVAAEARERALAEKAEKEAKEKEAREKAAEAEARRRAERAAVERVTAEARERAAAEARERAAAAAAEARERAAATAAAAAAKTNQQKNDNDLDSFFSNMGSRPSSAPRSRETNSDSATDPVSQNRRAPEGGAHRGPTSNVRKASSANNFVDDLSSIFGGGAPAGEFQDVEGETEERRRARLERHHRTQERAAKALAEKNERDMQSIREQEEKQRISATLDVEIKRWAAGKEGNLRALLSTLQYVLWPECGWQPVSLTDLITGASVKKAYRKATLCIHPDKVQQKGANLQQKYVAEKVFDILKEAWNKFNSEELF